MPRAKIVRTLQSRVRVASALQEIAAASSYMSENSDHTCSTVEYLQEAEHGSLPNIRGVNQGDQPFACPATA